MGVYRIYHVWSGRLKSRRVNLFVQWYNEHGYKMLCAMPGVKSVRAFARQFGLGPGDLDVEIWMEIENYQTYDRIDKDVIEHPEKYAAWYEIDEYLEQRSSRIMGDFPGSVLLPEGTNAEQVG